MTCGDERDESCCRDGHGYGGCGGHGHGHGHDDCRDGHGHHREGDGCCGGCDGGRGGRDQIAMFVVGPLETDCYAYLSGGECMVVDPGNSGAKIAEHLPVGATVRYIVATHGHGDHVGGVKALREITGGSYAIHAADAELARHAGEPSEQGRSYDDNAPDPDLTLAEGDVLELGSARFKVLEAPGHTPGGIVLLGEGSARGVAFVGDTLFKGSCGRTDLGGGDERAMRRTLARLKREIPAHTNLFCGHGDPTTMEDELVTNPVLQ